MHKVYFTVPFEICNGGYDNTMKYSGLFVYTLTHGVETKLEGMKWNNKLIPVLLVDFKTVEQANEFNELVKDVKGVYPFADIEKTVNYFIEQYEENYE